MGHLRSSGLWARGNPSPINSGGEGRQKLTEEQTVSITGGKLLVVKVEKHNKPCVPHLMHLTKAQKLECPSLYQLS